MLTFRNFPNLNNNTHKRANLNFKTITTIAAAVVKNPRNKSPRIDPIKVGYIRYIVGKLKDHFKEKVNFIFNDGEGNVTDFFPDIYAPGVIKTFPEGAYLKVIVKDGKRDKQKIDYIKAHNIIWDALNRGKISAFDVFGKLQDMDDIEAQTLIQDALKRGEIDGFEGFDEFGILQDKK